ncbi:MAG: molybdenum cofactor guanylyltransferase [Alcanivoracaceae bacterium]|nr:molybdenum cofactor guanylyltransferase [Alcanivoracaceae bacterium]
MEKSDKIVGVILNGGKSSRMGQDKSALKLTNTTLLEHTKQLFIDSGLEDIFISGKHGIEDKYQDKGPLAGILACLNYLTDHDFVLFIPVDMPLLTKEIITKLQSHKKATVVYFQNYNLPLMIKNNKKIRALIEKQIKSEKLSIYQLFDLLKAKALANNYPKKLFINTNSPQQWQNAKKIYTELNLNKSKVR